MVLTLVLLPALAHSRWRHAAARCASYWPRPRRRISPRLLVTVGKVGGVRGHDDGGRPARHSVDPALHGPHRLARTVPPRRARRSRSASRSAPPTLFGVSFALGAFFAGLVLSESELSQQAANEIAAAARRVRGAVLRLGRHAVRPHRSSSSEPLAVIATVLIIVIGKSLAALAHRAAVRLPAGHGAHDLREPGADRRVLVHSGGPRHEPRRFLPERGRDLILAGAILSISAQSAVLRRRSIGLKPWLEKRDGSAAPPQVSRTLPTRPYP